MALSRRAFTGLSLAAFGATTLGSCSTALPGAGEAPSPSQPSGTPSPTIGDTPTAADPSQDDDLVRAALDDELALLALLRATRRRHRRLREPVDVAIDVHQRHADLLSEAHSATGSPGASSPLPDAEVPRRPDLARAALVRAEETLVRSHSEQAVAAASGPLARVLASMAAGAAQQQRLLLPRVVR